MKVKMTIEIWSKGQWYIAKCPELDFISQGRDPEEAKRNLLEVVEIQFEEMREAGTFDDYLQECGYKFEEDMAVPLSEMIAFEKQAIHIGG
jgi:predicted RNase H-like HicB family nuclease